MKETEVLLLEAFFVGGKTQQRWCHRQVGRWPKSLNDLGRKSTCLGGEPTPNKVNPALSHHIDYMPQLTPLPPSSVGEHKQTGP